MPPTLLSPTNKPANRPGWITYACYAAAAAVLCFYGYVLFFHLGSRPFIDWDESIYAEVSKEALVNHQPFDFTIYGAHWFEKPPLALWTTELGFKMFGINEFGGRFFTAVFALATIILSYFFVKKLTNSRLAGFLTLGCYAICFHFFLQSFFLDLDIPVGFFILLTLYAFLLALEKPKFYYLFFTALALGVLTKSVIGLIPLPIALAYLLAAKKIRALHNKHFYWGLVLGALIVLPWHVRESIKFGAGFWQIYLFYHVLARFAAPLENNGGPFNYYFVIFLQNPLFLLFSAVATVYFIFKSIKNPAYFLLLFASVFIFLLFSLAQTKGSGYIVVIYPYLLAMMGITLADLFRLAPNYWLSFVGIGLLLIIFSGLAWQEDQFKILRLDNDPLYAENRDIAYFVQNHYPGKPLYVYSDVEGNLAFDYYLGKATSAIPANLPPPPANYWQTARYRVFHELNRSVYNFKDYLYIAP